MKRNTLLVLVPLAAALAACGKQETSAASAPSPASPSPAAATAPADPSAPSATSAAAAHARPDAAPSAKLSFVTVRASGAG